MDLESVARLQEAIDAALKKRNCSLLRSIEMGNGSEVTNLALCADVKARTLDGQVRGLSILAKEFVVCVLDANHKGNPWAPEFAGVYTTGGPLALVREITGESIVKAVIRYLELEQHRASH